MTIPPLFVNSRINILLIIDITLIAYLSLFVSGFSSLDDTSLMEGLQKETLTFSSLTPGAGMTYLRPLTLLTYLVDYTLWGANPAAFHGTNLLIHLLNSCLVYQICRSYFNETPNRESSSFLAALFFSLAPLNSESVAWVSGRTDLLSSFFFLSAILILITESVRPVTASVALFVTFSCSLLAKESSIALILIVPIYLLFTKGGRSFSEKIWLCSAVTAGALLYFIMRLGPRTELDTGTTKIIASLSGQSMTDLLYKSTATFGFYGKKLIWPFPLNLAIQSINEPLYFAIGTLLMAVVLYSFLRFPKSRLPLVIVIACLVPPLLALHGRIPWTLFAERYLYMPMTGFALMIGLLTINLTPLRQTFCFMLLIPLALTTVKRSGQWADPLALWHDTAEKSLELPQVHVLYAYELIQAGKIDEAELSINRARNLKFENELLRKCTTAIYYQRHNYRMNTPEKDIGSK